jgi:hypothetical protein
MPITREQFMQYEVVRRSGVTNMWDCTVVANLSEGLTTDEAAEVRRNYTSLKAEFPLTARDEALISEDAADLRSSFV